MKIVIHGCWDAEVTSCKPLARTITPEEYLKEKHEIYVCDVVIDGKLVGTVVWDGKKLSVRLPGALGY